MKYIISFVFFFLSAVVTVSAQDAVDIIAAKTCSCLKNMDTTATVEEIEAKMGICLITEAAPYQKELKKKNNIDMGNLDANTGKALGKLIGIKMLSKCPDQMLRLAGSVGDDKKSSAATSTTTTTTVTGSMTGTLSDIVTNQFVSITIKKSNGPEQKFLWLEYFEGADLLRNPSDIKGKIVEIKYKEKQFYNPSIKDYMNYKVITDLIIMEELKDK
jgi:hypothetical protein